MFNSLIGDEVPHAQSSESRRPKIRGTHVFTYKWDTIGGGYQNMRKLATLSNSRLLGWAGADIGECEDARLDLLRQQTQWWGSESLCTDINALKNQEILLTRDVFEFLALNSNIKIDHILEAGTLFYSNKLHLTKLNSPLTGFHSL